MNKIVIEHKSLRDISPEKVCKAQAELETAT